MKLSIRPRLLPALVLVSLLSFGVRVGDFVHGLRHMGEAQAQEHVPDKPPPMPPDAKKAMPEAAPVTDATPKDASKDASGTEEKKLSEKDKEEALKKLAEKAEQNSNIGSQTSWKDATEEQCSDTQEQLSQDLVKRRDDLDRQAKELATRQALLVAARHELDQKVTEMTNLRNEIQGMMGTLSDQEKARIDSLVKIYENMKPADAARIFDTLDTDVLIEVMSHMKEAKAALVMASMSSDRAKLVTVMLAQQKKLPDMPQTTSPAKP